MEIYVYVDNASYFLLILFLTHASGQVSNLNILIDIKEKIVSCNCMGNKWYMKGFPEIFSDSPLRDNARDFDF